MNHKEKVKAACLRLRDARHGHARLQQELTELEKKTKSSLEKAAAGIRSAEGELARVLAATGNRDLSVAFDGQLFSVGSDGELKVTTIKPLLVVHDDVEGYLEVRRGT